MKEILYRLFEHHNLDREQAREIMLRMVAGEYNDSQIAAFITVYLMRSITVDELIGFRDALLEMRRPVDLSEYHAIDIVGTGGDNKNTFNISTAACFTLAGAGYKVVKHGNYAATSTSGASNVLEQHGVKFAGSEDALRRQLDETNIAYLHAPLFNPALKRVAGVRKDLGVRTFFNMLGPLVNPVLPRRQMLGVYNLKLARLYNYLYQKSGIDFCIVHSLDGYDEISLTGPFKVIDNSGEMICTPDQFGFAPVCEADLSGGDTVETAACIFDQVLSGTADRAKIDAVAVNAAFAIRVIDPAKSIADCVAEARTSIESGAARRAFTRFVELSR